MNEEQDRLKKALGMETYGRLLAAAKITEKDALATARTAIERFEFLLAQEKDGWAIQQVRGDETLPVKLD